MRKERGITLVALVITIVVLIILAGVAITALTGDNNIIGKAKEAKEEYSNAEKEENEDLDNYSKEIDKSLKSGHSDLNYYFYDATELERIKSEIIIEESQDTTKVYVGSKETGYMFTDEAIVGPVDFGKGETCELVEEVEDVNVRFPNGIFYIYMGSLYLIKDGENWWLGEHNNYYQFGKIDSFDSTNAVDFKTLN